MLPILFRRYATAWFITCIFFFDMTSGKIVKATLPNNSDSTMGNIIKTLEIKKETKTDADKIMKGTKVLTEEKGIDK